LRELPLHKLSPAMTFYSNIFAWSA
jgi:predicted enzyme related to lactoylglutathione lyase